MSERRATDISRTPEEQELEKKRSELATLEGELAQRELELTTLESKLYAFEARYLRVVGIHYAELDELEAQIAEAQARLSPKDDELQGQASQARLQAILHEWETSPEAIKGDGIGVALVRVIRKIAQVEERLRVIVAEMAAWRASDLHQLQVKVEVAEDAGRNLLVEMAHGVEEQIVAARNRLAKITGKRTDI